MAKAPEDMIKGWKLVSELYPEQSVGHHNLAYVYQHFFNDYDSASRIYEKAKAIEHPWQHFSFRSQAYAQMARNQYEEAIKNLQLADEGAGNHYNFGIVDVLVAAKRYEEVDNITKLIPKTESLYMRQYGYLREALSYADRGMHKEAWRVINTIKEKLPKEPNYDALTSIVYAFELAMVEREGDRPTFEKLVEQVVLYERSGLKEKGSSTALPIALRLAIVGRVAARNGLLNTATPIIKEVAPYLSGKSFPVWEATLALLKAEVALQKGQLKRAEQLANKGLQQNEIYQAYESLARIYLAQKNNAKAEEALRWLVTQRGRTFAEHSDHMYGRPFNVADWAGAHVRLARLLKEKGDNEAAREVYQTIVEHWQNSVERPIPDAIAAREELAELVSAAASTAQLQMGN